MCASRHSRPVISKGEWGIGYLAGTGGSLMVLIVWWFVIRAGADFTAFVGTVTGIILSLTLVYLAYWLTQSDLEDEHVWAVSRWGAIGLLIPTVPIVAIAVLGVEPALRIEPSILVNVTAASAVIGALFGAVTELEAEHKRVLAVNRRNVVLNRLLRHDLRNDAAVLLLLADNLEDEFGAAGDEFAEPIREKTGEIVELSEAARRVDDLDRDTTNQPVDVADIVREQVKTVRSTHPTVDIETDVPEEAWVRADDVLRSVIDNVVENAIEHNDRSPEVRVSVRTPDGFDDRVEVVVADNGPGIPDATAEALSRRRTSEPHDATHQTGLGLWLVRWFVDTCDGELTIEDNDPRGTVVRIALPRQASPRERAPTIGSTA